jgi:Plavaka transposase
MGYSRNYQKYWDEKKRKRDEDSSPTSNAVLPLDPVHPGPGDPMPNTESSTILNDSDDGFLDCHEYSSDEETGKSHAIDHEVMSISSMSQSSDGNNNVDQDFSMYFTSKTYQKTSVPMRESCSFELMRVLDKAGSPRYLYEEVKALLNKQAKNGFQISEAMSRDVLMKSLYQQFPCPKVQQCKVSSYDVYKFPFVGMLQDLLDNCASDIHIIEKDMVNSVNCGPGIHCATKAELWNSSWMQDTFQKCRTYENFDKEKEIMLPLILYMDKTGTDALQRYSLEPVLFTTAAIPREAREKDGSWRHLGFIPPLAKSDQNNDTYDQKQLQLYHDFLAVLLEDLISAQKNPPIVTIERDGIKMELIARLPVMIVMGDQKSQDTLCGRKHANSGGAGRVHRSCMCSYITVDDAAHQCVDVCSQTIKSLVESALTSPDEFIKIANEYSNSGSNTENKIIENYLKRQQQMNSQILQYPFTQHALRNAFDEVDFGSWSSGIFTATFDDFMHSTESGLFEYIADLVFDGLTKTEKQDLETIIRKYLLSARSSVRSTYPRWRLSEGFSNQTRITCGEKVGSIFILALSLQYKDVAAIVKKGHARQIQKYLTFWSVKDEVQNNNDHNKENRSRKQPKVDPVDPEEIARKNGEAESQTPFFWEKHMQAKFSISEIKKRLVAMARHGFDLKILESLDMLQIHSLISHCDLGDCEYPSTFPKKNIPNHYVNLGLDVEIPKLLLHKAVQAFTPMSPSNVLNRNRFVSIEGTVQKHYRRKPKRKGIGSTAAILTKDIRCFLHFMEYLLSFHSFCRYSFTLPVAMQEDFNLIDFGSRTLIQYFEKMVYRGDDSVDSRTTKVHANKRVGHNHKCLGSCMHSDCQTGERLLKTKAKSIASTAQQRGNSIFECQAMHRIQDETVLSKYEAYLKQQDALTTRKQKHEPARTDTVTRRVPNFRYCTETGKWFRLDRKEKVLGEVDLDRTIEEAFFRLEPSLDAYEIHCEVQLRDQSRIRATPNYGQTGPWYDFVNVKWDENPPRLYPARCLAFYQKQNFDDGSIQLMALIHGADKHKGRGPALFVDTMLTSHYEFEYTSSKKPKIYAIPVATIEAAVLCFYHEPPKQNALFHAANNGFMMIRPRNEWAYVWIAWSETLRESNSQTRVNNRKSYVDLGSEHVVRQVRKKLQHYLS